jgi:hypothetical protein
MAYPFWRIVDRTHPHYPESGQATGEIITFVSGGKMAKMRLLACRHGTDACFVSLDQVSEIEAPEDGESHEAQRVLRQGGFWMQVRG